LLQDQHRALEGIDFEPQPAIQFGALSDLRQELARGPPVDWAKRNQARSSGNA
jgi:hypothetical protein